ncbi:hypothetical protein DEO72_LG6g814 [Vigna unguiculata]|uniref:Uncharacterized protein n=1 Tax=Vigna unguiculata TaxID=3917 RepID=A0A4D6M4D1_VIGUN|nr:hypothetical protein DEO72_LG6g814 [Vigna unguiculata]
MAKLLNHRFLADHENLAHLLPSTKLMIIARKNNHIQHSHATKRCYDKSNLPHHKVSPYWISGLLLLSPQESVRSRSIIIQSYPTKINHSGNIKHPNHSTVSPNISLRLRGLAQARHARSGEPPPRLGESTKTSAGAMRDLA